jgi:ankyrin repeat protein
MTACLEEHLSTVDCLLHRCADIYITNHEEETAFYWGCDRSHIGIVNLFIGIGWDIHKADSKG